MIEGRGKGERGEVRTYNRRLMSDEKREGFGIKNGIE
jgi:hypothetical protein